MRISANLGTISRRAPSYSEYGWLATLPVAVGRFGIVRVVARTWCARFVMPGGLQMDHMQTDRAATGWPEATVNHRIVRRDRCVLLTRGAGDVGGCCPRQYTLIDTGGTER